MAKRGRPAVRPKPWDKGIAETICSRIIAGESVKAITQDATMPSSQEFYNYMSKDKDFRGAIARAYESQQDVFVDMMQELADSATPEDVNVVKLRIWTMQWIAAKRAQKKYGEQIKVENSGDVTIKVEYDKPDSQTKDSAPETKGIR